MLTLPPVSPERHAKSLAILREGQTRIQKRLHRKRKAREDAAHAQRANADNGAKGAQNHGKVPTPLRTNADNRPL